MSKFDLIHIPEPLLEFRYSQKLAYPRDGLFLYGPVDEGRSQVKYGAIGTPAGVARLERWAEGVGGLINVPPPRPRARAIEPQHVVFPGFAQAYNSGWSAKPHAKITNIDAAALSAALHIGNRNEAIKKAVDLYVEPLIAAASRLEDPPNFWFVVIPEEVYELGRPQARIAAREKIQGMVRMTKERARKLEAEPTLPIVSSRRSRGGCLSLRHAFPQTTEGATSRTQDRHADRARNNARTQ